MCVCVCAYVWKKGAERGPAARPVRSSASAEMQIDEEGGEGGLGVAR